MPPILLSWGQAAGLVFMFMVIFAQIVFGVFLLLSSLDKLKKQERAIMAAIDDLNTAVSGLTTDVAALTAEVAAITPSAPPDLTGAIAGVTAADAAVKQATTDLQTKFPPAP